MEFDDPYTTEIRLCDDDGIVSHERVEPGSPGTAFDPDLTYFKMLNNLRLANTDPDTRKPYKGEPFQCTGSAHLAGTHIRCTSPAHQAKGWLTNGSWIVPFYEVNWPVSESIG